MAAGAAASDRQKFAAAYLTGFMWVTTVGLGGLFFSGEGLVCNFQGQGRLWISTRSARGASAIIRSNPNCTGHWTWPR